jgi:hypothetical protein
MRQQFESAFAAGDWRKMRSLWRVARNNPDVERALMELLARMLITMPPPSFEIAQDLLRAAGKSHADVVEFHERRCAENVQKVVGTEVTLTAWKGRPRAKTARVKAYIPPAVWELDKPLDGTAFHAGEDVVTLDGRFLWELVA